MNTLQRGREAFEKYLSLLDHYEILSSADKKLYQTYTESPTTFSTISTTDPNARRGAKIANFKLEKELKNKLEVSFLAHHYISRSSYIYNSSWPRILHMYKTTMMLFASCTWLTLLCAPIIPFSLSNLSIAKWKFWQWPRQKIAQLLLL